jgi:uncharacterized membrane protein YbhN (UPF0104 family)
MTPALEQHREEVDVRRPSTKRSPWRHLVRIVLALIVVAVCALGMKKIDWHQLRGALMHANLSLVLAAAVLNFVHLACKSERWRLLLSPLGRLSSLRLFYYLILGYAASAVLPARAGEAVRVYLLRRRDGLEVAGSIGVQVAEKLFEVLGILVLLVPLPLFLPLPSWARLSILVLAVTGVAGSVAAVVLGGKRAGTGLLSRIRAGFSSVTHPRLFIGAILFSVGAWFIDGIEVWLILRSLSIEVPWATPALVLLTLNLAIALPSTPGQLGAFEAGVVAGLNVVGVPLAPALAFALLYHAMQLIPILIVGATGLRLLVEAKNDATAMVVGSS